MTSELLMKSIKKITDNYVENLKTLNSDELPFLSPFELATIREDCIAKFMPLIEPMIREENMLALLRKGKK